MLLQSARQEALRMSFCIRTIKVAAGSLKCGWFAGLVVLVLTVFSISVAVSQAQRLVVCHSSISHHLFSWSSLTFLSFRVCCLFISCLTCRFLKASGQLRNGRASLRRKTTMCHLTRSEIQRKRKIKKKRARQPIRQKNLLVFKTVTSTIYSLAFYFFFQLCFLIPLTGSWLLWMARPLSIFTPSMHWCCR